MYAIIYNDSEFRYDSEVLSYPIYKYILDILKCLGVPYQFAIEPKDLHCIKGESFFYVRNSLNDGLLALKEIGNQIIDSMNYILIPINNFLDKKEFKRIIALYLKSNLTLLMYGNILFIKGHTIKKYNHLLEFSLNKINFFKHIKERKKMIDFKNSILIKNNEALCKLEEDLELNKKQELKEAGVNLIFESIIWIDHKSKIEKNTKIIGPTRIYNSQIGQFNTIDNAIVKDCNIGDNNKIGPYTYLEQVTIKSSNNIEFSVEMKRSKIGNENNIKHFAYIADMEIGNNNNFGAMFVSSNYNGKEKNKGLVENNCFIGSHTVFIHPIKVSSNCYIGAFNKISKELGENIFIDSKRDYKILENTFKKR